MFRYFAPGLHSQPVNRRFEELYGMFDTAVVRKNPEWPWRRPADNSEHAVHYPAELARQPAISAGQSPWPFRLSGISFDNPIRQPGELANVEL